MSFYTYGLFTIRKAGSKWEIYLPDKEGKQSFIGTARLKLFAVRQVENAYKDTTRDPTERFVNAYYGNILHCLGNNPTTKPALVRETREDHVNFMVNLNAQYRKQEEGNDK